MTWIKALQEEPKFPGLNLDEIEEARKDFNVKKMACEQGSDEMTLIGQYVASFMFFGDPEGRSYQSVKRDDVREIVMREIVPHFRDVKGYYVKGVLENIFVGLLKPESHALFQDLVQESRIHPFIMDVRGNQTGTVGPEYFVPQENQQWYEVDLKQFETVSSLEFDHLWSFMRNAYFDNGYGSTLPSGWMFGDHLQHSVALQYLSGVCKRIYLTVNRIDQRVFAIHWIAKDRELT